MVAVVVAVVSVVAACSSDAPGTLGGSPPSVDWSGKTSAAPVAGDSSNVATDLAPSQIAGSTVPAPTTPEPCDVDDLELWTAQLIPGPSTVGAVIRIRNDGNVTCDVDIGRSPSVDPAIEFDVWLERGATADLIVGQRDVDCDDPVRVTAVEVAIRGELITVPSVLVTCGWWLTAFYPNDPARSACERDALDVAVVADAVIVRNGSEQPCAMGGIVEVAGAPVASENSPGPAIRELRPGDVVASEGPSSTSATARAAWSCSTRQPVRWSSATCRVRCRSSWAVAGRGSAPQPDHRLGSRPVPPTRRRSSRRWIRSPATNSVSA